MGAGEEKIRLVRDVYDGIRVHPIAVHIPTGALPAAILFLIAGLATGHESLTLCAYPLLGFVVLALPVAFASGIYDWKHRFGGRKVPVFYWKIALSAITLALGIASLLIRYLTRGSAAGEGSAIRSSSLARVTGSERTRA